MKKRLFGILIMLAMVMCLAPVTAFAYTCRQTGEDVEPSYWWLNPKQHAILCPVHGIYEVRLGIEAHSGGTATCKSGAKCEKCGEEYGDKNPNEHSGYANWTIMPLTHVQKYTCCGYVTVAEEAHTWENGKCKVCDYECQHEDNNHDHMCDTCGKQISDHNWVDGKCTECGRVYACQHTGGTATCTKKAVCEICGEKYGKTRGNWYGEWTSNGDETHSAECRRAGCKHTGKTGCQKFDFAVENGNLVFCPVCGDVENGERLELIEEAQAEAVTAKLPEGELVARMNDEYLSIAFEYAGKLTTPAGQVKIMLPADLMEGKTLTLIAADGTETDLPVEIDEEGEYVSFTLDFTDAEIPAMLIRLGAEA